MATISWMLRAHHSEMPPPPRSMLQTSLSTYIINRVCSICSKREQKIKAQPPLHRRCKREGKSYTISWSKKINCQSEKLNTRPPALVVASNSGPSTGDPCPYHYTNELLAESKIQTVYNRNTRKRNIKVYAGIATLALAREPSAKAGKVQKTI